MKSVASQLEEVTLELSVPASRSPTLDDQMFEAMKKRLLEQLPALSACGILHVVAGKVLD